MACYRDSFTFFLSPNRTKRKYSQTNGKYPCKTASKGKSEPLLPMQGMSIGRWTAFSTPPVICEL
jgi:hypothetical protein